PVWCELLGDGETPVAAFARLRAHGAHGMLESVVGGERWARYSFIVMGARARVVGRFTQGALQVEVQPGEGFEAPASLRQGEGLAALRRIFDHYRAEPQPDQPPLWGGIVGAWGHDLVRCFEHLPSPEHHAPSPVPALDLVVTDTVVVFDNLRQRVRVVTATHPHDDGDGDPGAAYDAARARLERLVEVLRTAPPALPPLELHEDEPFEARVAPPWSASDYGEAVRRAQQHVVAGDVFQVVLAQGFETPRDGLDPLDLYRILRVTNPAPYMFLLELHGASLVGASPEVLVRLDRDSRRVTLRPIAGTIHRGRDEAEDLALEQQLLADPKERAEHLMLIDLGRNDVGRVAVGGTVRMRESFAVERYSRVMHIVSEVVGTLDPALDALDVLQATFPPGTLSGAPKVRALQLIDALEPADRGWYGGAVGYVGFDGGADFSICIRSALVLDDRIRVQAGAGIVYDSVPRAEDQETRNKAAALLRAVAMAKVGRAR
ncbi:MAG: anthranilate synthase component I family protein, partial [Myxococcales bacterium]|nr:anthranilate synthase component I family protein [Myxococcales bacterium]